MFINNIEYKSIRIAGILFSPFFSNGIYMIIP